MIKAPTTPRAWLLLSLLYLIASCWLASWLAISWLGIDKPLPGILDIVILWYHYHDTDLVRQKLFLVSALPLLLPVIVLLLGKKPPKLYGDARWANSWEVRKMNLYFKQGIVLGKYRGRLLMDDGIEHILVAAPTRSGKGVGIAIPNLLTHPGSSVVLDIKFENYDISAAFRQSHGQEVYLFAPGQKNTHRWNPLDLIDTNDPGMIGTIQMIANIICPTSDKADDPMWTAEARNIFIAAVLAHIHTQQPLQMNRINAWIKLHADPDILDEFITDNTHVLGPLCTENLVAYRDMGEKQRSGVQSTITSQLSVYDNPLVAAATACSDFNIADLRRKKMTIYLGATLESIVSLAPIYNLLFQAIAVLMTQKLPGTG